MSLVVNFSTAIHLRHLLNVADSLITHLPSIFFLLQVIICVLAVAIATMGIYTQLPKDLEEVNVIIAGGKYTAAESKLVHATLKEMS